MVGCSILGCKSRSERKVDEITFHKFPCNEAITKKWLVATGRLNWLPTKYSRICSIHFNDESFKKTKMRVELKRDSVPEKHIHTSSSYKRSSGIILQEVHNVQPQMVTLALKSTLKKEKKLKLMLQKVAAISSIRLKKIRALRESKRRLLKKTVFLENIITELKSKLLKRSDELNVRYILVDSHSPQFSLHSTADVTRLTFHQD